MLALRQQDPVGLARIALLIQFDAAALLGYTGAVFGVFLGSALDVPTTLSTFGFPEMNALALCA